MNLKPATTFLDDLKKMIWEKCADSRFWKCFDVGAGTTFIWFGMNSLVEHGAHNSMVQAKAVIVLVQTLPSLSTFMVNEPILLRRLFVWSDELMKNELYHVRWFGAAASQIVNKENGNTWKHTMACSLLCRCRWDTGLCCVQLHYLMDVLRDVRFPTA